jgi:hypothetical protein
MAHHAGIYKHLWRPEEIDIVTADQLIEPLRNGLAELKSYPQKYRAQNAPNGWGSYENLVSFVENYLDACEKNPRATIGISR